MTDGPNESFDARATVDGGTSVLTVRGELDLETAPRLSAVAYPLARASVAGLVVDLTGVRFLSSSAITVLVRATEELPESARMALVAVDSVVVRPVELSGIDRLIATFADLADAVAHVQEAAAETKKNV